MENKEGNKHTVLQPRRYRPPAQLPRRPHAGDRALPGTPSFTITKGCSKARKWSALLQPCSLCTDGRMDRQTRDHFMCKLRSSSLRTALRVQGTQDSFF